MGPRNKCQVITHMSAPAMGEHLLQVRLLRGAHVLAGCVLRGRVELVLHTPISSVPPTLPVCGGIVDHACVARCVVHVGFAPRGDPRSPSKFSGELPPPEPPTGAPPGVPLCTSRVECHTHCVVARWWDGSDDHPTNYNIWHLFPSPSPP